MKNALIIIVIVVVLGGAAWFGYDYMQKKNYPDATPPVPDPIPRPTYQADENVRQMQMWLNTFDEVDPKLSTDGVWGPKTQSAFDTVQAIQNNGDLTSDESSLFDKFTTIADDVMSKSPLALTPQGILYNASKGVADGVKGAYNWVVNLF